MKLDDIVYSDVIVAVKAFIKKALFYLGRSILVILGVVQIVFVLKLTFEQSLSFIEISTLEMIFFVVLFFLVRNYYAKSISNRRGWKEILYVIVSSMGWLLLAFTFIFILVSKIMADSVEWLNFDPLQNNTSQMIVYIAMHVTIYLVTPKDGSHEHKTNNKPDSGGQDS
jgi:hypothetical protein